MDSLPKVVTVLLSGFFPCKLALKFPLSRGRVYAPALETGLALLLTIEVVVCRVWDQASGLLWAAIHFCKPTTAMWSSPDSLPEGETPHRVELRVPGTADTSDHVLADDPDERMGSANLGTHEQQ